MAGYTAVQGAIPVTINLGATVAAAAAETWFLFKVPAEIPTAQLIGAHWGNGAAITASDANYTTLSIMNGATTMATVDTRTSGSGGTGNVTADTAYAFTLSTTVANRRCVGGDTLTITKAETGTGAAVTAQSVITAWFIIGTDDLVAS